MVKRLVLVLVLVFFPKLVFASDSPVLILVSGFTNQPKTTVHYREGVSYYNLMAKGLREKGFKELVEVTPSLSTTASEFSTLFHHYVVASKAKFPDRPIVLLGHSRGAPYILEYLLSHPSVLVNGTIGKVVFIQGALNGSFIGSLGLMTSITWALATPLIVNKILKKIPAVSEYSIQDLISGFSTVSHGIGKVFKRRILKMEAAARSALNEKLIYIRSHQPCGNIDPDFKLSCQALRALGPNDGLLLLKDQVIPGVGKVIADLESGHMDLIFAEYGNEESRKNLIDFGAWIAEKILELDR